VLRAIADRSSYEYRLVGRENLLVALPEDHKLTARSCLKWSDLHRQRYIDYEPLHGQYFHRLTAARMTLEGIAPEVVQSLAQIHSILALVRAGTGLAVVPESARMMAMRGLTYREFDDANPVMAELFVVWNRENYNPLVPIIAQIATSAGELRRG
jgi:DNA-binding transcriptional LysR family regulator